MLLETAVPYELESHLSICISIYLPVHPSTRLYACLQMHNSVVRCKGRAAVRLWAGYLKPQRCGASGFKGSGLEV